ncbi:MAG: DUF4129 domain-containing protein [Actinomycetota bacterium]|nr:DUF4129 domain-containing protein [Actinomycetota bacterium]
MVTRERAGVLTGALACLLACMLALAAPAPAAQRVLPADEYRSRVGAAIDDIDVARDRSMDSRTASELAADVNTLLPITLPVEVDGQKVVADNSILRTLVSRLDAAKNPEDRADLADEMRRHLVSLEASLGGPGAGVPEDRETLEKIIAAQRVPSRSPLAEIVGKIVERLLDVLQKWWASAGGSPRTATILSTGMVVLLAVLLAFLGWTLVRALLRARAAAATLEPAGGTRAVGGPVVAAAEGLPADALAYADELAGRGLFREAVRALFGGAARALVEAGVVVQTRTRTDAELLAEVNASAPRAHGKLRTLAVAFETAYYGHVDPDAERYEEARAAYESALAALRPEGGDAT